MSTFARLILSASLALCSVACVPTDDDRVPVPPEILAPGVISTAAPEFAFSLSPRGDAAYFNRIGEDGSIHIYQASQTADGWRDDGPLGFSDPRYLDVDPFVSRDGTRLYFSSTRPKPGSSSEAHSEDMDTWYAIRQGDGWSAPAHAGTVINSPQDDVFVSETATGTLVFARFDDGEGRQRATTLLIATRDGDGFADPLAMPTAPAGLRLSNPAISPNGNTLVAAGSIDGEEPILYVSTGTNDGWSAFTALPSPINRPGIPAFAPYIGNDGKTLYFTAEMPEDAAYSRAIYRTRLPE